MANVFQVPNWILYCGLAVGFLIFIEPPASFGPVDCKSGRSSIRLLLQHSYYQQSCRSPISVLGLPPNTRRLESSLRGLHGFRVCLRHRPKTSLRRGLTNIARPQPLHIPCRCRRRCSFWSNTGCGAISSDPDQFHDWLLWTQRRSHMDPSSVVQQPG